MKPSVVVAVCVAALPAVALALQPLVTDDTGTQGAGGNQLEAAYDRTVDKAPDAKVVTHQVPLVFTRGVTDTLDLYVGLRNQRIVPTAPAAVEHGWSNVSFGAKWLFYDDETGKRSLAFKPEIQLPVSKSKEARGLGTARTSYGVNLVITQETGFGAVHANVVAARVSYADDALNAAERRAHYRLSVAPVWDVAEGWKLALDAGLMTNPDRAAGANMGYVELGAIYSRGKDLDLAIGIIRNVRDGNVSATQATLGVTFRFR